MVKRQCPKCKAIFDRKSHYDYHINRKNDCSPNDKNNNVFQKNLDVKLSNNYDKTCDINTENINLDLDFNCCYCLKSY